MIELPCRGYYSPTSSFVAADEVAAISTRAKHSMDDHNTTVVTLKGGATFDTSLSVRDVRALVEKNQ